MKNILISYISILYLLLLNYIDAQMFNPYFNSGYPYNYYFKPLSYPIDYNSPTYTGISNENIASIASNLLGEIESKILKENVTDFVNNKYAKQQNIIEAITINDDEIKKIHNSLDVNEKNDKIHRDLLRWLNIKMKEGKMMKDEVQTFNDIMLTLTKIEVAKYLAQLRYPQSNQYFPQSYDNFHTNSYPDFKNSPPVVVRNLIHLQPQKNIEIEPAGEKKSDFVDLEEKINIRNKVINKPNHMAETNQALASISYIQKIINMDPESIMKLIYKVKSLISEEIDEKERLIKNYKKLKIIEDQLSKRHFISSPTSITNPNQNLENNIEEAKLRLWAIKNIEWLLTQIEAVKYLAKVKQTIPQNHKLQFEDLMKA